MDTGNVSMIIALKKSLQRKNPFTVVHNLMKIKHRD